TYSPIIPNRWKLYVKIKKWKTWKISGRYIAYGGVSPGVSRAEINVSCNYLMESISPGISTVQRQIISGLPVPESLFFILSIFLFFISLFPGQVCFHLP